MMKVKLFVILAIIAMVAGKPGTVRSLKKKKEKDDPKTFTIRRHKGGPKAGPEEVDVGAKLFKCKEGDDACKELKKEAKEVTEEEFGKLLAEGMMAELKEEEEEDEHGRQLCYWVCEYYLYCYYGDCWIIEICTKYC